MTALSWLRPGQLIIDNSFSPPSAEQLVAGRALGVAAEMRYTSTPVTNPKNLTAARAGLLHGLGLGALANQEQSSVDSYEGEAGGRKRARSFVAVADAIGYPREAPAVVSHDTGLHALSVPFVAGFDDEVRRVYGWQRTGVYIFAPEGIEQMVQAGLGLDFLWQAYAGSTLSRVSLDPDVAVQLAAQAASARWGGFADTELGDPEPVPSTNGRTGWRVTVVGVHRQAHAFQRLGYHALADGPFPPGQVDENIVLRPLPVWLPGGTPIPTPGGADMATRIVAVEGANARFLADVTTGELTGIELVRELEWVDGTDPRQLARYQALVPHCRVMTVPMAALANMRVDRVPTGDGAHAWTGAEFGAVTGAGAAGPQGPKGDKGDPGVPGRDGADGPTPAAVVDEIARRLGNG